MILIEDTRQKVGKHDKANDFWGNSGVRVIRCKLPYGDYAAPPRIVVDTKASIHEIATNLCGSVQERARVREECKLAAECGAKLVFLIEVGKYKAAADLIGQTFHLKSGKTVPGEQLARAMAIMSERYGCKFEFCPPKETGQRIMEILQNEEV